MDRLDLLILVNVSAHLVLWTTLAISLKRDWARVPVPERRTGVRVEGR